MPWVNVIANETFGFLVSESGAGYTWSRNSRENRLTPWYNDPVTDPYGEALYVRDEDARVFWSPLPGPVPLAAACEVRHGFGYTQWRHRSVDLEQEVLQFVPRHDPVKITRLRLTNTGDRTRRLSLFAYHRLVLGALAADSSRFVITEVDSDSGAILAQNRLNNEFYDAIVFAAAVAPPGAELIRCTGDRTAFVGRHGCLEVPAAVGDALELDGRTGAGLDPCAALQVTVHIEPGATVECSFLLGENTDKASARALVERYRRPAAIANALRAVRKFWTRTLSAVRIETPSPAIDLMVNGWLLYQDLSCRLWGRSAFYQSGGAFGFRDQLQDAAALIYSRPDLTRAQIVLHATHQFVEGDVLHWWHPPTGRGIRTHFSDDLLWLPYVTAFYVHTTGDWGVLDQSAGFVMARALEPDEDEACLFPQPAGEAADIYTHCCRALDRSLTCGAHGLPLMGTGDWNDGMNRVGREGRGESVWLGFFLYRVLGDFIPICERRAERVRAQRYPDYQAQLRSALDEAGWDGSWYRRAYYDDGTPLGSAQNEECRIDALAQAWAVLSKAAPPERAAQAMDAVERQLVSEEAGLIRLLTPPFDRDPHDPGYIKGYVPGIRENGGQYTHAAIWVVQALAELGRRERAAAYLEMLGPISHTRTPDQVAVYQVEPYVVAADIYGVSPHVGRGGWTWYTGSAGWMYRVALESVLGFRLDHGNMIRLKPCIPDHWPQFRITFRLFDEKTRYEIVVHNPTGCAATVQAVAIDGQPGDIEAGAARIPLVSDGCTHAVAVVLGS
jgi:cyclic beta-1,2-glucan synthetase